MRAILTIAALSGLLAAACGDKVTIIECPLGTEPVGSECIPLGVDLIAPLRDADTASRPDSDAAELPLAELPPGDDTATDPGGPNPDLPITGPDVILSGSPVGAACAKSSECQGAACLDWPGGYCTAFDCTVSSCPSGSRCMPLAGGNSACLATCESDADCRADGQQACKTLESLDGTLRRVCHGVATDAESVGGACLDAVGCASAMSCLPSLPGGYCAALGCTAGSCAVGSKCYKFGGFSTCLKTCGADADCGGVPGAERRCGVLKALDGSKTGACISGAEGLAIGAQCSNDFECSSGSCEILGAGRCTQGAKLPCFLENEAQVCGGDGGFCYISGQNQTGACVQPCGLGTPCPGLSLCAGAVGEGE